MSASPDRSTEWRAVDWTQLAGCSTAAQRPGARLVLQVLAMHADARGVCYPSTRRLQRRVGLGETQIGRHLSDLRAAGVLVVPEREEHLHGLRVGVRGAQRDVYVRGGRLWVTTHEGTQPVYLLDARRLLESAHPEDAEEANRLFERLQPSAWSERMRAHGWSPPAPDREASPPPCTEGVPSSTRRGVPSPMKGGGPACMRGHESAVGMDNCGKEEKQVNAYAADRLGGVRTQGTVENPSLEEFRERARRRGISVVAAIYHHYAGREAVMYEQVAFDKHVGKDDASLQAWVSVCVSVQGSRYMPTGGDMLKRYARTLQSNREVDEIFRPAPGTSAGDGAAVAVTPPVARVTASAFDAPQKGIRYRLDQMERFVALGYPRNHFDETAPWDQPYRWSYFATPCDQD